ncbi:MAG: hypothetical protein CEE38_22040 [Planctomycetes bacterium B3_Pla]|nr:MAG: hypothetical protein CEE38_22040 [Planctomycetes bacterium B3_Pla]
MIFENIQQIFCDFIKKASTDVVIFCPYIKLSTLKSIIKEYNARSLSIVTTWKTLDILRGISDLELYPFCKDIGAFLYINQNIHLKVIVDSFERAIVGSANITNKGLGIASKPNDECVVIYENLTFHQQVHLTSILQRSHLIRDGDYNEIRDLIGSYQKSFSDINKYDDIDFEITAKRDFLISVLPMSKDISTFFRYYSDEKTSARNQIDYKCATHDAALYDIPNGLSRDEFDTQLKSSFFEQPFIKKLKEFIANEKYFGQIKEWIQRTCVDVPVPSKRSLTGNAQVLYEWFAKLGQDEYGTDRPSHSQRIFRKE